MRAVIFDWDGTLVDTAEASYRCYVRMFAAYGMPFDRELYAQTYSPNWHHTYRCVGLDESLWAEADARWLGFFAEERVQPIDGARELIDALHARGLAPAIVTSGSRDRVQREIAEHGFAFHQCVFGDELRNRKPHPEGLLLCLSRLGIGAHEAMYVGDSPEDVQMARAAGVYSVAVPGPYPNRDALAACGADAYVDSLRSIWSAAAMPPLS
jgi:HAD superfamily hydrolase (TIGR01509 family)